MKKNITKDFYNNLFADCKRKTTKQLLEDLKRGIEITFNKRICKRHVHNNIDKRNINEPAN